MAPTLWLAMLTAASLTIFLIMSIIYMSPTAKSQKSELTEAIKKTNWKF
uniref:ATP synthase F0 subunit 8 n=1 Tax=Grandidierella japonica TaxID=429032 RepID=A0A5H2XSF7_GRAJA|nr:ATP synthase F0 subunit 8 [Grandidierella japonica]